MRADLLTQAIGAPVLGPYRRRDYDQLPDWPRHELLFGRLYVTPSPTVPHQVEALELVVRFRRIARVSGGRAFIAPLDVHLAEHSIVQPDVLYVSAARGGIVRDWIEGAPDLVVEFLSPGTVRRDRGEKLLLYAQYGVQEYWLGNVEERRFEFLVNEAGRFVPAQPAGRRYQSPRIPEIHLDVQAYWRAVAAALR